MKARLRDLPKRWKNILVALIAFHVVLLAVFIGFQSFLTNMRADSAAKRAAVQKADSALIGTRFTLQRDGKAPVEMNLYFPENRADQQLPVIFNLHGGGFMLGDADEMDTQCNHWANQWNTIVVSIDYTKADVKPISYGVEEVVDTVLYFAEHAADYGADPDQFSVIGHSAGGHYAARAAIVLDQRGFQLAAQILMCPWTTGLPDQVNATVAPALFILGSADEISQKSATYQQVLKECGVSVTVKEYEGGLHPFVCTPYPELALSLSDEERIEFITEEQQLLALQAENDIGAWLKQQLGS